MFKNFNPKPQMLRINQFINQIQFISLPEVSEKN